MEKLKLSSVALVAFIAGGGVVYTSIDGTAKQIAIEETGSSTDLLINVEKTCLDEIKLVGREYPDCSRCKTQLGNDKDWTEGWCCDGAFMPVYVQKCLDEAFLKIVD